VGKFRREILLMGGEGWHTLVGDAAPVFYRRETVVCHENSLHFFEVGVPIEGRVAAEKEVGDDADSPEVT
jgi:hypothetical protein